MGAGSWRWKGETGWKSLPIVYTRENPAVIIKHIWFKWQSTDMAWYMFVSAGGAVGQEQRWAPPQDLLPAASQGLGGPTCPHVWRDHPLVPGVPLQQLHTGNKAPCKAERSRQSLHNGLMLKIKPACYVCIVSTGNHWTLPGVVLFSPAHPRSGPVSTRFHLWGILCCLKNCGHQEINLKLTVKLNLLYCYTELSFCRMLQDKALSTH